MRGRIRVISAVIHSCIWQPWNDIEFRFIKEFNRMSVQNVMNVSLMLHNLKRICLGIPAKNSLHAINAISHSLNHIVWKHIKRKFMKVSVRMHVKFVIDAFFQLLTWKTILSHIQVGDQKILLMLQICFCAP